MKVALVHDYLKEYGGAERVLEVLSEMWPEAPIYTAFVTPGSSAAKIFKDRKIIPWKHQWLINRGNLHSPLRFLIPKIWESFSAQDGQGLLEYDLVISSASGYVTKGVRTKPGARHVCYCHTPPRWLYGYPTAREWQKWWPVRMYGNLLKHELLKYDFQAAQRPDVMIANSKNVAARIKKFYRREAEVIYPPVKVKEIEQATKGLQPKDYYLVVSRLVGAKGWELLFEAVKKLNVKVKVVGEPAGSGKLGSEKLGNLEWLGRVSDEKLWKLYGECKALLALAEDEDFGITPVEAMAAGRPVIAFAGGGYLETVAEGKTGVFFKEYSVESLVKAMKSFREEKFKAADCRKQAEKFSQERFVRQMRAVVKKTVAKA